MSLENSLHSFHLVARVFTYCYKINMFFNRYWKPHCFQMKENGHCFICFIQIFIKIVDSVSHDLITLIWLGKDLIVNHAYVASLRTDMYHYLSHSIWTLWKPWKKIYSALKLYQILKKVVLYFESWPQCNLYWFLKQCSGFNTELFFKSISEVIPSQSSVPVNDRIAMPADVAWAVC